MTSWACRGDELGQQPTNRADVGGVAPTRVLIGGPRTPGIAEMTGPLTPLSRRIPRPLPVLRELPPRDPARTTNGGGFCNPTFDHLVTQAETLQLTDPAAAQDTWARADHLAVDQAAWTPLVNTASAQLLSRRASHFTLDADGLPQIDQLWVR
jgi:ABC-type transport system substrate-binding protein